MESVKWTETHDYLHLVMKRELETIRQLLDNMNLEEQFILKKQKKYWSTMLEERSHLKMQLEAISQDKIYTTKKLEKLTCRSNALLEELLPAQDTNSWEILSLRDQTETLLERIKEQTNRNEMLVNIVAVRKSSRPKNKITVATLTPEGYKEGDG